MAAKKPPKAVSRNALTTMFPKRKNKTVSPPTEYKRQPGANISKTRPPAPGKSTLSHITPEYEGKKPPPWFKAKKRSAVKRKK